MIHIALYQPDIPQNVGAAIRLAACMRVKLDVIEPCGFPWDEKRIQKSAMDYVEHVELERFASWEKFKAARAGQRILLMTTKAEKDYLGISFQDDDILLAGRESSGVPIDIHQAADEKIMIKMNPEARSLNIVNATSMILGEALRQTRNNQ